MLVPMSRGQKQVVVSPMLNKMAAVILGHDVVLECIRPWVLVATVATVATVACIERGVGVAGKDQLIRTRSHRSIRHRSHTKP
jgi:hypothetical protein